MNTRRHGPRGTDRQGATVRGLAWVAVVVTLGASLAASDERAPGQPRTTAVTAQPSAPGLPPYVAAPAVVLDPRPTAHPATGRPVGIRVIELDVDVPVIPIALSSGLLVPPADPQVLGWWAAGAEPGALRGTAVVTGHTVSTGGGALDRLHRLRAGDRVVVRTTRGRIGYRVDNVAEYSKTALARVSERVFDQRSPGRLVLVTCTDFDGREYLGNTLVFASVER